MSQRPMPGPGRGERRARGGNITATWDWLGGITPMLESMFNRWDRMARIAERSAARRPSMEMHAFRQKQKEWEQSNKLFRESEQERKFQRDRQMKADHAAKMDRQRALAEKYGISPAAAQGVTAGPGSGMTSPHQSEAQLSGWGVEGAVYDKNGNLVPMMGQPPPPVAPGVGAPGAGGSLIGDINVSASGGGVAPLAQGPRYSGAMVPTTSAFNAMVNQPPPQFESADIDKEKKRRDD